MLCWDNAGNKTVWGIFPIPFFYLGSTFRFDYDKMTFTEKKLSNDHVGNDWSFTYTHNGQTIKSGYTITQSLEVFTFQSIGVEIREKDKIDDVGTGTLTVAICEIGSGRTEITVTENAGAFKGNTAVWEISCEVTLVGKQ